VDGAQRFAGSFLQAASAVHHSIDAGQGGTPGFRSGRASNVEPQMTNRNGCPRRATGNADNLRAKRVQTAGDRAAD
jgi:hypothetical protein